MKDVSCWAQVVYGRKWLYYVETEVFKIRASGYLLDEQKIAVKLMPKCVNLLL